MSKEQAKTITTEKAIVQQRKVADQEGVSRKDAETNQDIPEQKAPKKAVRSSKDQLSELLKNKKAVVEELASALDLKPADLEAVYKIVSDSLKASPLKSMNSAAVALQFRNMLRASDVVYVKWETHRKPVVFVLPENDTHKEASVTLKDLESLTIAAVMALGGKMDHVTDVKQLNKYAMTDYPLMENADVQERVLS